ncbi:unnamed protein product, partial [marine sediment metagenome]
MPTDRDAVLAQNRGVLNDGGARHLSFGQATLNIPFADRKMLGIKYPDLDSKDGDLHARAWRKFNKSRE